jgi:hypothetical protein
MIGLRGSQYLTSKLHLDFAGDIGGFGISDNQAELDWSATGMATYDFVKWFSLSAAGVMRQAITLLKQRNITFAVSRADRSFRSWIERYHFMELIDPARFYPTNRHAAQAFRQSSESGRKE